MDETNHTGSRAVAPALDALLGKRHPVLDDGFVRVVDYMGTDESIVQGARVSYGRGTKQLHEDRGLIRYLMRNWHTSPFEMCELKLHVRVPMDTWRQWIRHRTASVNEYSTRYSLAIDAAQQTEPTDWRSQSHVNRQGSSGKLELEVGRALSQREKEFQSEARKLYEERIESGVAREQARKDLPLSTYTEAYWKIDLHNLLNFLNLRLDEHAQLEIREYARVIGHTVVKAWCPLTWEAFVDYRLDSTVLSTVDLEIVRAIHVSPSEAVAAARRLGLLPIDDTQHSRSNRERDELEKKLLRLGLPIPWKTQDA
ncbi:FAD-dependent thymidylate synthase [Corallococcus sp. M34]|uniref:FAD-dependent thymidylate synthase n=1 Tax=Citreicoccus inhibens TaxID=2849499 RepID=UPI001C2424E2|nr:FAD-dependent thymidylate synthase [Citreicoccus inhibens]MBU8900950.1 FAD-dependent thymidylate synthase [Citreicoccus inhibens]